MPVPMNELKTFLFPDIMTGKAFRRSARLDAPGLLQHVSVILEQIAEGETRNQLLAGYPKLKKEDIQAAFIK